MKPETHTTISLCIAYIAAICLGVAIGTSYGSSAIGLLVFVSVVLLADIRAYLQLLLLKGEV